MPIRMSSVTKQKKIKISLSPGRPVVVVTAGHWCICWNWDICQNGRHMIYDQAPLRGSIQSQPSAARDLALLCRHWNAFFLLLIKRATSQSLRHFSMAGSMQESCPPVLLHPMNFLPRLFSCDKWHSSIRIMRSATTYLCTDMHRQCHISCNCSLKLFEDEHVVFY